VAPGTMMVPRGRACKGARGEAWRAILGLSATASPGGGSAVGGVILGVVIVADEAVAVAVAAKAVMVTVVREGKGQRMSGGEKQHVRMGGWFVDRSECTILSGEAASSSSHHVTVRYGTARH
jgi:hypothetical protein